jgi:hypothetical protein
MAPAQSRDMVESAIFDAKNGPGGIEFNRELLLDELENETIEVDGVVKQYYQIIGKIVRVLFSILSTLFYINCITTNRL